MPQCHSVTVPLKEPKQSLLDSLQAGCQLQPPGWLAPIHLVGASRQSAPSPLCRLTCASCCAIQLTTTQRLPAVTGHTQLSIIPSPICAEPLQLHHEHVAATLVFSLHHRTYIPTACIRLGHGATWAPNLQPQVPNSAVASSQSQPAASKSPAYE